MPKQTLQPKQPKDVIQIKGFTLFTKTQSLW